MKRAWWVGLGILSGLWLGWTSFERYHHQRIYPGVQAAGVAVGGLTLEEAAAKVAAAPHKTPLHPA